MSIADSLKPIQYKTRRTIQARRISINEYGILSGNDSSTEGPCRRIPRCPATYVADCGQSAMLLPTLKVALFAPSIDYAHNAVCELLRA